MNTKRLTRSFAVLAALGATTAQAITTTGNNLTVLGGTGLLTSGTNDVTFTWDGTYRTAVVADGTSNASLSSPTPFFGKTWTVHNMNIYAPGTYVFNTGCPAGDPSCMPPPYPLNPKLYELTVPAGYLGAHLLFDWATSTNIDIVLLWKLNASWDASGGELGNGGTSIYPFCAAPLTSGGCNTAPNPNGNTRYTVWDAVSVDTPASTIRLSNGAIDTTGAGESNLYHGTKMVDGPYTGQGFNFNIQGLTAPVPLPPAVWLFGSGLMGLLAAVRRKKRI